MDRRRWLMVLVAAEALYFLVIASLHLTNGYFEYGNVDFSHLSGGSALMNLLNVLPYVFAVLIGVTSKGWQGAAALPVLASLPILLVSLLFGTLAAPNPPTLIGLLGGLGVFGWLLRFVRAEFAV